MTSFDAGAAHSRYDLDISGFKRSFDEVRQSYAELEKLRQGMATPTVPAATGGAGASAAQQQSAALRQTSRDADQAFRAFQQVEREQQRLADSQIRAARASHDYAGALAIIDEQLRRASTDTVRYNDLLARHAVVSRQATEGSRSFANVFNSVQQGLGAAGIAIGVQQLVQGTIAAGQYALELRRTEATARALAGSTEQYNTVLALARQNQILFGGTLADNINNLQGFEIVARRTGVSLAQLDDISKRLHLTSPEQSAGEATVALNELFSGNATSLQRRFEIPPEVKDQLNQAKGASEQLKILDAYLTSVGVTSAAVGGSIDDTSKTFNRLGAEAETAKVSLGALVADGFAPTAKAAADLLAAFNTGTSIQAQGQLFENLGHQVLALGGPLKGVLGYVDAYNQMVLRGVGVQGGYNEILRDTASAVTAPVQAIGQYNNAALRAVGINIDWGGALQKTGEYLGFVKTQTQAATDAAQQQTAAIKQQTTELGKQLGDAQDATQKQQQLTFAQQRANDLAGDVTRGYLTQKDAANQLAQATGILPAEAEDYISAQQGVIQANEQMQRGLQYVIRDQQDATKRSNELKNAQSSLAQLSGLVSSGLIAEANAAAILGRRLNITTLEAQGLIDKEIQLAEVQRLAQNQQNVLSAQAKINQDRASGRQGRGDSSDLSGILDANAARADAVAKAQRDQDYALGTAAQRIPILQADLAKLRAQGATQAVLIEKETEIKLAQQQAAADAARATKSGTTRINQQATLNDKLVNSEEDLQTRIATIQRNALEKQLDAQEQYNRDRARSNEDYAISASRSLEDEQRKERKLLAEGKILEARSAREGFDREQRRNAEDQQRKNQRAGQDYADARRKDQREVGEQIADAQGRTETQQERAARTGERKGLAAPGVSTDRDGRPIVVDRPLNTGPLVVPGVPVGATIAALAPRQVNVAFQANVLLDGQKVGELVGPHIVTQVDEALMLDISITQTANAPGLQQASVREVR